LALLSILDLAPHVPRGLMRGSAIGGYLSGGRVACGNQEVDNSRFPTVDNLLVALAHFNSRYEWWC